MNFKTLSILTLSLPTLFLIALSNLFIVFILPYKTEVFMLVRACG